MILYSKNKDGEEVYCQVCENHYQIDYEFYCLEYHGGNKFDRLDPGYMCGHEEHCSLCMFQYKRIGE